MIIQPYDYFLVAWFLLAGLSTAYVAVDQFRNNPEPTVMKWGFILVTLYCALPPSWEKSRTNPPQAEDSDSVNLGSNPSSPAMI